MDKDCQRDDWQSDSDSDGEPSVVHEKGRNLDCFKGGNNSFQTSAMDISKKVLLPAKRPRFMVDSVSDGEPSVVHIKDSNLDCFQSKKEKHAIDPSVSRHCTEIYQETNVSPPSNPEDLLYKQNNMVESSLTFIKENQRYLKVRCIIGKLHSSGIISMSEKEDLNSIDSPSKRVSYLLGCLRKSSIEKMQSFCQVLKTSSKSECLPSHKEIADKVLLLMQQARDHDGTTESKGQSDCNSDKSDEEETYGPC